MPVITRELRTVSLAVLSLASLVSIGAAQSLGPDFVGSYTVTSLGAAPGVPVSYGGLVFKAGDPNTILLGGSASFAAGAIYEVPVGRDAGGHVISLGAATQVACAPNIDSGLTYGPGGVLFFSTWPTNTLGQFLPGSTVPDKVVDLSALGVSVSTGCVAFVPNGFPGAGSLKISTLFANNWYDADVVPDGMGTYDVVNVAQTAVLLGGPGGFEFVDTGYPAFSVQSVLISEHVSAAVGAYELDANGDPIPGTRRTFLALSDPEGITIDPLTGDFLFSTFAGPGSEVVVVSTAAGPLGTSYCGPAVPNSTGAPGVVSAFGSPFVAANDVTLTAAQLPADFGYFLNSMTQGFVNPPASSGFLCLSGAIGRHNQPGLVQPGPSFSITLDLGAIPTPTAFVAVNPGETWNFQAWYRDSGSNNFTDGLEIPFQ